MMLLPLIDHVLVYGLERYRTPAASIRIDTEHRQRQAAPWPSPTAAPASCPADSAQRCSPASASGCTRFTATTRCFEPRRRVRERGTQAILEIPYEPADRRRSLKTSRTCATSCASRSRRSGPSCRSSAEAEDGIEALRAARDALARHPVPRHPDARPVRPRGRARRPAALPRRLRHRLRQVRRRAPSSRAPSTT